MAGGTTIRRDSLQSRYERLKHTLKYDPDLTTHQLYLRFHISHEKIRELRKEVEDANKEA